MQEDLSFVRLSRFMYHIINGSDVMRASAESCLCSNIMFTPLFTHQDVRVFAHVAVAVRFYYPLQC